mmetsp:Transcript_90123/g.250343  ORF Transcript_90123/g.250343 Transcript_90123/m.250343 type:complete len:253 (+) Transcript_90123:164-922(+)
MWDAWGGRSASPPVLHARVAWVGGDAVAAGIHRTGTRPSGAFLTGDLEPSHHAVVLVPQKVAVEDVIATERLHIQPDRDVVLPVHVRVVPIAISVEARVGFAGLYDLVGNAVQVKRVDRHTRNPPLLHGPEWEASKRRWLVGLVGHQATVRPHLAFVVKRHVEGSKQTIPLVLAEVLLVKLGLRRVQPHRVLVCRVHWSVAEVRQVAGPGDLEQRQGEVGCTPGREDVHREDRGVVGLVDVVAEALMNLLAF